jgi:hypothetical protein
MRRLAVLAAAVLAAVACGASQAAPLTAAHLARRLPGCHRPFTPSGGVSVQAATEQECLTPAAEVFVATFTGAAAERQWITANMGSACGDVQGRNWAAEVLVTASETGCPVEAAVAKALGGRLASG